MDWITIFEVIMILFTATLIKSCFGFGEAECAVPLLTFIFPLNVVVPLVALTSITVAAIIVIQDREHVHFRGASVLLLSTLFGIPIGIFLLKNTPEHLDKFILGIFLLAVSLFYILFRHRVHLMNDKFAWISGFIAGISGGVYSMNGPSLAIYGSLRRWNPKVFRATLQSYFFVASSLGLLGYGMGGLIVPSVIHYYLLTIPATIIAVFIGRYINHRMSVRAFSSAIYFALLILALLLIHQGWKFVNV